MKITKSYLKEQIQNLLEREEESNDIYYITGGQFAGNVDPDLAEDFKKLKFRSRDLHEEAELEYAVLKSVIKELNIPEKETGANPSDFRKNLFVRGHNESSKAKIGKLIRSVLGPSVKFNKLLWLTPAMEEAKQTLGLYGAESEHEYKAVHNPLLPGEPQYFPRPGGTLYGQYKTFMKGLPKKPEGVKEVKITKSYLKQIIKEEITRLGEEEAGTSEKVGNYQIEFSSQFGGPLSDGEVPQGAKPDASMAAEPPEFVAKISTPEGSEHKLETYYIYRIHKKPSRFNKNPVPHLEAYHRNSNTTGFFAARDMKNWARLKPDASPEEIKQQARSVGKEVSLKTTPQTDQQIAQSAADRYKHQSWAQRGAQAYLDRTGVR